MANYSVIYRHEQPKWQLGCPVYVSVVQVSRDIETVRCYLQVKLQNLTDVRIDKIVLGVRVVGTESKAEEFDMEFLDAMLAPGGELVPQARELEARDVTSVEVYVKTVGTVTGFGEAVMPPTPRVISVAPGFAQEFRETALKSLGKTPEQEPYVASDMVSWWQCSCGAVNVDRATCRVCGIHKTDALRISDAERYDKLALARTEDLYAGAKVAMEEGTLASYRTAQSNLESIRGYEDSEVLLARTNDAIKRLAAEDDAARKKRTIIIASILTVLAIAAVLIFAVLPAVQANKIEAQHAADYQAAVESAESGDYAAAVEAFRALGDYADASEQADYLAASVLFDAGDYEGAYELFNALASGEYEDLGYKDSKERAEAARRVADDEKYGSAYDAAMKLYNQGKFNEAFVAFCELGHYEDSSFWARMSLMEFKVGSTVTLGYYEQDNNPANGKEPIEWIVLSPYLLVSKYVLDCRQFNRGSFDDWEHYDDFHYSDLYSWLNGDFKSDAELTMYPFAVECLSAYDAGWYFSSNAARIGYPTAYAVAQGAWVSSRNGATYYWLSDSTATELTGIAYVVHNNGTYDSYYAEPSPSYPWSTTDVGVRPTLVFYN